MAFETLHHGLPRRGLKDHKVLIAAAILAIVYCIGAPALANLLAHFGS